MRDRGWTGCYKKRVCVRMPLWGFGGGIRGKSMRLEAFCQRRDRNECLVWNGGRWTREFWRSMWAQVVDRKVI